MTMALPPSGLAASNKAPVDLEILGPCSASALTRTRRNTPETDTEIGALRLKALRPFALSRLGRDYEIWQPAVCSFATCSAPLPLRPYAPLLAARLGCGVDFIYELVARICRHGPENVRASDMLKHSPNGGKGTARLEETVLAALDQAVWEVCVERGLKPCRKATNQAIRGEMLSKGFVGRMPVTKTIRLRSKADKVTRAREDAYARDHLQRIAGLTEEIKGLMTIVQLDTTQFTDDEYELLVVDQKGRIMGPANVIFGILGSNRGVWTHLPFAGAPNGFLSGLAIKRGLLAKDELLTKFGIRGVLPFHGKPGEIRHDGGSEFVNDHVKRVLHDMHIGFDDRSPPATPHYRGQEERFNHTAHVLFAEFLESSVGRRYLRAVPGRPKARGILLADLDQALTEWIVRDYHARAHKGLGNDSPMSRFEKFVLGGNGLPPSGLPPAVIETPRLIWDFLWEERRVVNHLGISLDNRRYARPELSRLFALNKRSSERLVSIRFNPYAMKFVYVMIPDDDGREEMLPVPWRPENGKYLMDDRDRQAAIDPSMWEWDALFADIRRGGNPHPGTGVAEELHAAREAQSATERQDGAPKRATRIGETRNRGMRGHYGQQNLPSPAPKSETTDGIATSNGRTGRPETTFEPNTSRRIYRPAYLEIKDGADSY
jgi:hypothetical protein